MSRDDTNKIIDRANFNLILRSSLDREKAVRIRVNRKYKAERKLG